MFRFLSVCSVVAVTTYGLVCNTNDLMADEIDLQRIGELHLKEAKAYSMFVDPQRQKPLEFQPEPIFKWQNLSHPGGQLGAIFVWTREGRPECVGTMFTLHEDKRRKVVHEFHTLADTILTVDCPKDVERRWQPKGTLTMSPLERSPAVAETAVRRLTQMRSLAREFSGFTQSGAERTELRLAPQPLIRYQPTRDDVLDGAIFAFLSSSAGTDPEALAIIEARKTHDNPVDWTWHFAIARFTDRDLVISRDNVDVFSSISNTKLKAKVEDGYKWTHNSDDTYYVFQAKFVPELTKTAIDP